MEIMGLLNSIILGIPQGALYGLMGFGIALIFRSAGVLNFSHGHLGMFCVFIAFSVYTLTKSILLAIVVAAIAGFLLGIVIDKLLMHRIKHLSHGGMLIITLGLLMIFEGMSMIIWGTDNQIFPEILKGAPVKIGAGAEKLILPLNDLVITIIALGSAILIALLLQFSKWGVAARARAQDEIGARVVGINTNTVDSLVWGIGIVLSVLVGVLIAPKTYVHPNMMVNMQLYGFTAGVLGGFSSVFGAIYGGLVLGILEKIIGRYINPDFQISLIFILIILILALKPSGLFSKSSTRRV